MALDEKDTIAGVAEVIRTYGLRWRWHVSHDVDHVWRGITTPATMSQWMNATAEIEPRVGGRMTIDWGSRSSGKQGIVVEVEAPSLIVYTWPMNAAEGEPGCDITLVRWALHPAPDGGTTVTFSHTGLTRAYAQGLGSGWVGFLDRFHAVLDGRPFADDDEHTAAVKPMIERWIRDFDKNVVSG